MTIQDVTLTYKLVRKPSVHLLFDWKILLRLHNTNTVEEINRSIKNSLNEKKSDLWFSFKITGNYKTIKYFLKYLKHIFLNDTTTAKAQLLTDTKT